jgi:ABC-type transporter Mla subunit MlaD
MKQTKAEIENKSTEHKSIEPQNKINGQAKLNGQQKPGRAISDPKEVAQLVMMRIDHVNATKDELTTAVKALADTAKQLVSVYAKQQGQIEQLARKVEELEKAKK